MERLQFESLVIELATGFINLDPAEVDLTIETCLQHIVEALDIDRSTLFQLTDDGDMGATHSWARPGFETFPRLFARSNLPWAFARVTQGTGFEFSNVEDLPEEAAADKAVIRHFGPRSNVTIPLAVRAEIIGALCFGSMRTERTWSPALLQRLRSVAHLIASVLARKRMDQELQTALAEIERLRDHLQHENTYLREQAASDPQIVGQSAAIRRTLHLADRVASTEAPVLLMGETGVGKELVAEAIHARSARGDRTMVKLNCAALPASLVEAELFGREKGAYTGALTKQIGRFELADGATLFLDEVCELPLELQAKLLRVLQTGDFERLGSPHTVHVDVRIIAATNRDIEQAVAEGRFRSDLYFRLAVFPILVPPLRERPEDIPSLVRAVVDQVGRKMGRRIETVDEESLAQLRRYSWPGNVRELRNVVERALILNEGATLHIDLPASKRTTAATSLSLEDVERGHILRVLELTRWRVRGTDGAGVILGLPPTTLETRMAKLGIRRPA